MRAQDAWWRPVKETLLSPSEVMEGSHPEAGYPQSRGEPGHHGELRSCQAQTHAVSKGGTHHPLSSSPSPPLQEHRGTL